MSRPTSARTLNLGILAHVDAGKTTLTERLLYAAGAIDRPGSVDRGTTRTDSLALERERGITIRSAVAGFALDDVAGDLQVNLIDTPGHPDFIAEVERVLGVLDGVVLVVSAVEGVQPQTKVLMRALQRLTVPVVVFVNKTDRTGADVERVLAEIRDRLTPYAVPLPMDPREAVDLLSDLDDRLLADFVSDERRVTPDRVHRVLAEQTRAARLCPVLAGSAATGDGVEALLGTIVDLLAPRTDAPGGAVPETGAESDAESDPVSGRVFKVERGPAGERVAYVRLFGGALGLRDRVVTGSGTTGTVVGLHAFRGATWVRTERVGAGEIAQVRGLDGVRVGDALDPRGAGAEHHFPPPTLEAVVAPRRPEQGHALEVALGRLADQDPLIGVRHDDAGRLAVSLYGRVQQEVIAATLAREHGIEVDFEDATVVHVERPRRRGESVELVTSETNDQNAAVGLRIEPGEPGSGLVFAMRVPAKDVPLYLFKSLEGFGEVMERHVRRALAVGLCGWRVTDAVVTLIQVAYTSWDGPPSTRGPLSTSVDYRLLTPRVVRQALRDAGTVICGPVLRVYVEFPTAGAGVMHRELGRLGASTTDQSTGASFTTMEVLMPAARFHELQRRLPDLTGGEGVCEPAFAGYEPLARPVRRVTMAP